AGTMTRIGHTGPATSPVKRSNAATEPTAVAKSSRRDDCHTTISALFSIPARLPCGELPNTWAIGGLQLSLKRLYGCDGEEFGGVANVGWIEEVCKTTLGTRVCCDHSHSQSVAPSCPVALECRCACEAPTP